MDALLEKFEDVSVLIVGDVMLDQYWWGNVNRISPEAPVPIVSLEKKTTIAGGAANVAANVAGLGAKPYLVGLIGNDDEGKELSASLEDIDVSDDYLIRTDNRPTTSKTRIVANNQQVTRVDHESSASNEQETEALFLKQIESVLTKVDVVIISDYAKGVVSVNLARQLIELCSKEGRRVLVDPKGKDYSKYQNASILTPNQKEALEACGYDELDELAIADVGKRLLGDLKLENLLITRGEKGMSLFSSGDERSEIEANARRVFDVTGAGDTVIATLAVSLASGSDFYKACELANVAAGLVVEKVGTRPISLNELREYFENPINV